MDLDLKNIYATGLGGFVVHRSYLNLKKLSFDLEISVPRIEIYAGTLFIIATLDGYPFMTVNSTFRFTFAVRY
jgi:hypothetical protein